VAGLVLGASALAACIGIAGMGIAQGEGTDPAPKAEVHQSEQTDGGSHSTAREMGAFGHEEKSEAGSGAHAARVGAEAAKKLEKAAAGSKDRAGKHESSAAKKHREPSTWKYVVQQGDTLSTISAKTGVSADRLIEVNHVTNPDFIYEGSALQVPGGHHR
jgi:LysM repeat protein